MKRPHLLAHNLGVDQGLGFDSHLPDDTLFFPRRETKRIEQVIPGIMQPEVSKARALDFAKATSGRVLADKSIHTMLAEFMGARAYTSPEQAELDARDIDTRSDIYSLGALLCEPLTGRTPFHAQRRPSAGLAGLRASSAKKGCLDGHQGCVYCVRVESRGGCGECRPGRRAALETGEQTSQAAKDLVWSLAISSDGRQLVAGLENKTTLLLELLSLPGGTAPIFASFPRNGSTLARGGADGSSRGSCTATSGPGRLLPQAHLKNGLPGAGRSAT